MEETPLTPCPAQVLILGPWSLCLRARVQLCSLSPEDPWLTSPHPHVLGRSGLLQASEPDKIRENQASLSEGSSISGIGARFRIQT